MNYKILLLAALSSASLKGYNVLFAPYESPLPLSLESRFEGYVWHNPQYKSHCKTLGSLLNWTYAFNGYVKHANNYFFKMGIFFGVGSRTIRRLGVDFQVGKYWDGIGAIRFGCLNEGIGIGGDFWLIYKDQFKWLTTLEISAITDRQILFNEYSYHNQFYCDSKTRPHFKWLNRLFVFDTLYISFGIDHIDSLHHTSSRKYERSSVTQAFLGFGSTI